MNAPSTLIVPLAVVRETFCGPEVPAGVTAVIAVPVPLITMLVTKAPPTFTLVAPNKFVPTIVIVVPPKVEPLVGVIDVIVVAARYVNAFTAVAVPPRVVTTTYFAPTVPAGVSAVMEVLDTTTTFVAATPPTVTLLAPVKLVPVMVMAVAPKVVPEFGLTLEIVGTGVM